MRKASFPLQTLVTLLSNLSVYAAIFILFSNNITDADFWWHLKTGQYIFENRTIPHTDIFSHTAYGRPWTLHEWPTQVILYGVYSLFGFAGIVFFTAAMGTVAFALLDLLARKNNIPGLIAKGSLFAGALAIAPFVIPRPQIFYYILWAALIFILDGYRSGKRKLLLGIPLVFIIWANIHASVFLIFLLIGLYAISEILIVSSNNPSSQKDIFLLLVVTVVGGAMALLNINTFAVYTYLLNIFRTNVVLVVTEWQSFLQNFHTIQAKILIAYYFFVLISFLVSVKKRLRSLTIKESIMVFPFIVAAFLNSKFIPVSIILSVPFLAKNLQNLTIFQYRNNALILAPIALIGSLVYQRSVGGSLDTYYGNVPEKAAQFILDKNISGNLYNHYDVGGYVIWKLFPRYKVFIDGRNEMFEPDVARDFDTMLSGNTGWEESLSKYDINLLLLHPKDVHQPLAESKNWVFVYFDNIGAVFVRDSDQNRAIITAFGYRHARPFLANPQYTDEEDAAIQEYLRSLENDPDIFKSHYDLGLIYLRQRNYARAEDHLRQAIRIFPESKNGHYQLGVALEKQGRVEEAQLEYRLAGQGN